MNDKRITLGVVAISYNEERDLPGFLDNLVPWVDEIIIIDDGSTDGTRKIAETAAEKARFIVSPRVEGKYYADQRNKGIDIANSDWLIHMDIDERIPPDFAFEILEALRNPDYDAYRYRRMNYFLHRPMRGGDWKDWNLVHLAKRECLRFSGMYHEKVEIAVPQEKVGQLKGFMLHLNDESYAERLRKSAVYQVEVAENVKRTNASLGYFDILKSFIKEFVYQYFWKRGFLDGVSGLIWAFHAASAQNRAYILAWDEQNRIPRENLEKEIRLMWDQQSLQQTLHQKGYPDEK
jgi:glycosyltransferase involved in cell wall biosynthesis